MKKALKVFSLSLIATTFLAVNQASVVITNERPPISLETTN